MPFRFPPVSPALALCAAMLVGSALADEPKPITPKLTPRLLQLLSEEMLSVKQAMEQMLGAIASGDHQLVATNALMIHDSFILKKQLTEQDKKDLAKAAPVEFLKADGAFHQAALRLNQAALTKDQELELFYFHKLVEGCQSCHSTFAADKFPGFSGKTADAHVH